MCLEEKDGAVMLKVLVQPRASKNEVVGIHGDCLKIRVTSPPVEGKAKTPETRRPDRVSADCSTAGLCGKCGLCRTGNGGSNRHLMHASSQLRSRDGSMRPA